MFDVVIPTAGRPCLPELLAALGAGGGPRPDRDGPLPVADALAAGLPVEVVRGSGAGPAAARNLGWRASGAEWIAFLDDDVVTPPGWAARLADDVDGLPARVAGSQ